MRKYNIFLNFSFKTFIFVNNLKIHLLSIATNIHIAFHHVLDRA